MHFVQYRCELLGRLAGVRLLANKRSRCSFLFAMKHLTYQIQALGYIPANLQPFGFRMLHSPISFQITYPS